MGRRKKNETALTTELIERICFHILRHNFIQTAHRMEGVSDKLFSEWMERAVGEPSGIYGELKRRIEIAEADAETRGLNAINKLADDGLASAIMWRQERRYAGSWAKKEPSPIAAVSGPTVQIILPPNGREALPAKIDLRPTIVPSLLPGQRK